MSEISFTSSIRGVSSTEFNRLISKCTKQNFVDYPWTIKETKKAADVYTKSIADCTACVISDGQEAIMLHLSPENSNNHAFSLVLQHLRNLIDLKNPNLQAILVGSKNTSKSQDIFSKFKILLEQLNIPYSTLKNSSKPVNIAYSSTNDEIIVSNIDIDKKIRKGLASKDILTSAFEKIDIANCDNLA